MSPAWQALFDELAQWRDAGLVADFWWRDDDASHPDPALERLMGIAAEAAVPLALAAIPEDAQVAAFELAGPMVSLLQHGVDHRNRADGGEKKTEFPASELVPVTIARLAGGRARLGRVAGGRLLPVLVPPWNRISAPQLVGHLAEAGYTGLSTFGPRRVAYAAPGLKMVNTHVDIIDWRGTRGFVGEDLALGQAVRHLQARRSGHADALECTGWLTHHAVHDEAAWTFMALLLERTRELQGLRWRVARELFVP